MVWKNIPLPSFTVFVVDFVVFLGHRTRMMPFSTRQCSGSLDTNFPFMSETSAGPDTSILIFPLMPEMRMWELKPDVREKIVTACLVLSLIMCITLCTFPQVGIALLIMTSVYFITKHALGIFLDTMHGIPVEFCPTIP